MKLKDKENSVMINPIIQVEWWILSSCHILKLETFGATNFL